MRLSIISKTFLNEYNITHGKYKPFIKDLKNKLRTTYGLSIKTINSMSDNLIIESYVKLTK